MDEKITLLSLCDLTTDYSGEISVADLNDCIDILRRYDDGNWEYSDYKLKESEIKNPLAKLIARVLSNVYDNGYRNGYDSY